MNFQAIQKSLQGKKTYIATGFGILYLIGVFLGLWEWSESVLAVFGLSGLAFLRSAVPKAAPTTTTTASTSTTPIPPITPILLLALILTTGCTTLEQPGPYNGDQILYRADHSITATYATLDAFVTWEYEHRATLAQWPEIRQAAEFIRTHARDWIDLATAARDKYAAYRSPETRAALADALTSLKTSAANSTALLDLYGPRDSH